MGSVTWWSWIDEPAGPFPVTGWLIDFWCSPVPFISEWKEKLRRASDRQKELCYEWELLLFNKMERKLMKWWQKLAIGLGGDLELIGRDRGGEIGLAGCTASSWVFLLLIWGQPDWTSGRATPRDIAGRLFVVMGWDWFVLKEVLKVLELRYNDFFLYSAIYCLLNVDVCHEQ